MLKRHIEIHRENSNQTTLAPIVIGDELKCAITEAVGKTFVVDVLPINFFNQKAPFVGTAKALFEVGQRLPQGGKVSMHDALQCASTVGKKRKLLDKRGVPF